MCVSHLDLLLVHYVFISFCRLFFLLYVLSFFGQFVKTFLCYQNKLIACYFHYYFPRYIICLLNLLRMFLPYKWLKFYLVNSESLYLFVVLYINQHNILVMYILLLYINRDFLAVFNQLIQLVLIFINTIRQGFFFPG